MTVGSRTKVIQQLYKVIVTEAAGLTDGQLLERFVTQRDEASFEALVRRHGPMVFGVCQRVHCNPHDAEDAFQATFLVLVRKAASVAPREMVANWLYGVAYQTAFRAKVAAAKRWVREKQVKRMPEPEVTQPEQWHDLRPLLDQELSRLPDKYRVSIVLCDLQGKTHDEARQPDWPIGTVSRLARQGLALSAGSLAAALSQQGISASVPSSLVVATANAANAFAAGKAAVISAKVAGLTERVLQAMFLSKLKVVTGVLLVASILGAGVVASGLIDPTHAAQQAGFRQEPQFKEQAQLKKPVEAPDASGKKIDLANIGALDERKIMRIAAPTAGRIEKIYKVAGEQVKKGDALAELYSPDLMVTTREFLAAERGGNAEAQSVARERLLLFGMERDQISAPLKNGKPVAELTVRAPLDGYVIRKQGNHRRLRQGGRRAL